MNYTEGTKVTGNYYGIEITGTIKQNRLNYRSYKSFIWVELDNPKEIFGEVRSRVIFDSVDEKTGYDLATDAGNRVYPVS